MVRKLQHRLCVSKRNIQYQYILKYAKNWKHHKPAQVYHIYITNAWLFSLTLETLGQFVLKMVRFQAWSSCTPAETSEHLWLHTLSVRSIHWGSSMSLRLLNGYIFPAIFNSIQEKKLKFWLGVRSISQIMFIEEHHTPWKTHVLTTQVAQHSTVQLWCTVMTSSLLHPLYVTTFKKRVWISLINPNLQKVNLFPILLLLLLFVWDRLVLNSLKAGLKLTMTLLSQPPESWDFTDAPLCPATFQPP